MDEATIKARIRTTRQKIAEAKRIIPADPTASFAVALSAASLGKFIGQLEDELKSLQEELAKQGEA